VNDIRALLFVFVATRRVASDRHSGADPKPREKPHAYGEIGGKRPKNDQNVF
jgi:hypothetical protein